MKAYINLHQFDITHFSINKPREYADQGLSIGVSHSTQYAEPRGSGFACIFKVNGESDDKLLTFSLESLAVFVVVGDFEESHDYLTHVQAPSICYPLVQSFLAIATRAAGMKFFELKNIDFNDYYVNNVLKK